MESPGVLKPFTTSDIKEAIKLCNLKKALGVDSFDGSVLLENLELCEKIAVEIATAINSRKLP
jgi:hypothetical protein